jgi:anionic cell wall polymer biosynthesis LytR-Cps2A-Psr (LCP) family protein
MVEEEVRAAFARHEHLTPAAGPLRAEIDRITVRRRRRRLVVRATGAALVLVAVAAVPVYGSRLVNSGGQQPYQISDTPPPPTAPALLTAPALPAGPLNTLLVGVDTDGRGLPPAEFMAPSAELMVLAHIPADRSRIVLVSIPADLPDLSAGPVAAEPTPPGADAGPVAAEPTPPAAEPGPAGGKSGSPPAGPRGPEMMSEVFRSVSRGSAAPVDLENGTRAVAKAITDRTGLSINAIAMIEFSALRALTDAVGGVEICVKPPIRPTPEPADGGACRRLSGKAGTELLRQRYKLSEDGYDAQGLDPKFLKGLYAAARANGHLADARSVARLALTAGKGLRVDTLGAELGGLFAALGGIGRDDTVVVALPTPPGGALLRTFDKPYTGQIQSFFAALAADRADRWLADHPDAVR